MRRREKLKLSAQTNHLFRYMYKYTCISLFSINYNRSNSRMYSAFIIYVRTNGTAQKRKKEFARGRALLSVLFFFFLCFLIHNTRRSQYRHEILRFNRWSVWWRKNVYRHDRITWFTVNLLPFQTKSMDCKTTNVEGQMIEVEYFSCQMWN